MVAAGVRRVSENPLDSNLVTGLVGVAGVFLGIFADRLVQRYGKLRFESDAWEAFYSAGADDYGGTPGVEPSGVRDVPRDTPVSVRYSFEAKLFNEKEVDTGISDVRVAFWWDDGGQSEDRPYDTASGRVVAGQMTADHADVLDLPSRRYVQLRLHGYLGDEPARKLPGCKKVVFRARFPSGRKFERPINTGGGPG